MTEADIQISQSYFGQLNTAVAKRGKMCTNKSQLILLSPLIGGEERNEIFKPSNGHGYGKRKQSRISFVFQWKQFLIKIDFLT